MYVGRFKSRITSSDKEWVKMVIPATTTYKHKT